jgi:hypothetical protein
MTKETYLGDGLYASFDGWQIQLRAPRDDGDHVIYLDPDVLRAFQHYIAELKTLTID